MGAPKTKVVGGGSATPTANAFNKFLLSGLTSGTFQGPGQTSAFGNALNSMLGSSPTGYIENNPFLQGMTNYNPTATLPNAPQFQNVNLQNLNTNAQGGNTFSQLFPGGVSQASTGTEDISSFLKNFGFPGSGGGQPGVPGLGNLPGLGPFNMPGAVDTSFSPGKLLNVNTDSPEFAALSALNDRNKQRDVADLRARFGSTGNAFSTGASAAEGQYLAEANPRNTLALGELARSIQGMDLSQQQINNAQRLGMTNAGVGDAGNRMSTLANIFGIGANYNLGGRGQDVTARGQDINSLLQQGQTGLGWGNLAGDILRGNQGYNQGMMGIGANLLVQDASNALSAFGLNNQALQNMNLNNLNLGEMMNNFNMQGFGQSSQNALQNQQLGNNWQQALMGAGLDLSQLAQSGQMGALSQIFGALGQANQLGTPQAQVVQKPSNFSQAVGAIGTLGPLLAAPFTGGASLGLTGLGGPSGGMPSFAGQTGQSMLPMPNFPTTLSTGSAFGNNGGFGMMGMMGRPMASPGLMTGGGYPGGGFGIGGQLPSLGSGLTSFTGAPNPFFNQIATGAMGRP